jgi:Family of unknown function (DUF6228)
VKDGSTLVLSAPNFPQSIQFEFVLTTPELTAKGTASTYVVGSPALLFDQMANSWRGWSDPLVWGTLDGEIRMSATTDSLGHIDMSIELRGPAYPSDWELTAHLYLEAGGLEALSSKVRNVFPVYDAKARI